MMKKFISLILLVISSQFLLAQEEVYKIDYTLFVDDSFKSNLQDIDSTNENADLLISMLEGFKNESLLSAWVGKEKNKIQSNYLDVWIQLRDTKAKTLVRLDTSNSTYSTIAYNGEPNLLLKPVQLSTETKTIAGQECKLAIFEFDFEDMEIEETPKIEVWYSEKIPQIVWGEYQYLTDVPGAALEISTSGVSFIAKNVSKLTVPNSFFDIPDGYTEVDSLDPDYSEMFENIEMGEGILAYFDQDLNKYGMKKENGEIITEPIFGSITPFNNKIAIAFYDLDGFALIDVNGKNVSKTNFEYIGFDPELNAYQYMLEGRMSMMDDKGNPIWKNSYEYFTPFTGNYSIISENGQSGVIDKKGDIVVPLTEHIIVSNDNFHYITEEKNEFKAYEIKSNKFVISGYTFLSTTNSENIFKASEDGENFGLINKNGEVILPFEYVYISDFTNGLATAMKNGENEEVTINTQGEIITE
jgi:GLPGLI family protein